MSIEIPQTKSIIQHIAEKQKQIEEVEAPIEIPDDAMDDMIEALVTNLVPTHSKIGHSREEDPKERCISDACKDACKAPLYEGTKNSKLRAVLLILNLQATFGWSDASFSALFQLTQKILPFGNCVLDT